MSVVEARDAVTVAGTGAEAYLQGQLSNDVVGLGVGESRWSFLLEPSGKLGHLVRVARPEPERYVLDTDAGSGEAIEARLRRFFLRTKATITRDGFCVDVDGEGDGDPLAGWWGTGWHRITERPPSPAEQLTARRVAAGWPGPAELAEGTIPGETQLVPLAVSFAKGCYTGQELVARIDSRGNNVPRLLRRVELGEAGARPGDELLVDGSPAGVVTSVAGPQALAYVARRVEVPGEAVVGARTVRLLPVP